MAVEADFKWAPGDFEGDENVLKLSIGMVVQLCKFTELTQLYT